ncbi:MAG: hypothetical protein BWK80_08515 [Desulfobacteraceae bacterium IS3]|nr:MAG: hypothetical protein BWK80_08515 [Desulfobacteraceae bacterium IS3]
MILARFIRLCSSVLAASAPQEAAALTVNRISELVRVDRAVLVSLEEKEPIAAVTGGGAVAQDGSFADAVEAVRRQYGDQQNPTLIPAEGGQLKSLPLRKVQQAMGGTAILWLPLWLDRDPKIPPTSSLWLERWGGIPWEKADVELLQHAALFLGHGIGRSRDTVRSKKRFLQRTFWVMLGIFLLFPVTSSVTAPVQVVPDRPHHIFAPMDGILKDLFVQPGQQVNPDTVLFQYDARVLEKRLDEAHRNVAVAKATLARLEGKAYRDPESRAELPVKQLEVERAEAEADFFATQLARAQVRTAKSGVIVLDDPDALIGASIRTGQVILSVADPSRTKLRLMVPASDAGLLKEGARVKIRLDSNPLGSISAVITRVGFEIKLSEDQLPSVLAEAVWSGKNAKVQPGQKGSAKIFGGSTLLGIQLLRKPLIKLRNFIGI